VRFLLDANLPRAAVQAVVDAGHEAVSVHDGALRSASDEVVFAHALATSAVLVTRDLDFSSVLRFPPAGSVGIVVLRLPEDSKASDIADVITRFLLSGLVRHLPGRLAVVEPDRVRFRPALGIQD
jgi:predicted nuclease of predicted toxin-antitoxin system